MPIETPASGSGWLLEPTRGDRPFRKGDLVMDGWEIVRRIGKGGFSTVYRISKNMMNAAFESALKVITIPQEDDFAENQRELGFSDRQISASIRNQVEMAAMEVRAMISLAAHPAVVRIEDFSAVQYEDTGNWEIFIRMELLTSLTDWVKANPVTQEIVRGIGISIADLLRYGETQHVLHHDIKPDNLFMNSLNMCKLGDFGLVRMLSAATTTHSKGAGTEAFIAPEVSRGENYDIRSDVYSLGLVLYWMLNGHHLPFSEGERFERAMARRMSGEAIPPVPGVDPRLMRAVLKACAFRPEDRFDGGEAFCEALRKIGPLDGEKEKQEEKPDEPPRPPADEARDAWKDYYFQYDAAFGVTITRYKGAGGAVKVPAVLGGHPVRAIGSSAFADCLSVRSVTFPEGLAEIGDYAFFRSGLQRVVIPATVSSVGRGAFDSCHNLTEAVLPDGLLSIASSTFNACTALRQIRIPNTVTFIGTCAFANSGLEEIRTPSATKRIENRAFFGCRQLRRVILDRGLTRIGSYAFSRCTALEVLMIPATVTEVGVRSFHGDAKLTVTVAGNLYVENLCRVNGIRCQRIPGV